VNGKKRGRERERESKERVRLLISDVDGCVHMDAARLMDKQTNTRANMYCSVNKQPLWVSQSTNQVELDTKYLALKIETKHKRDLDVPKVPK